MNGKQMHRNTVIEHVETPHRHVSSRRVTSRERGIFSYSIVLLIAVVAAALAADAAASEV